MASGAVKQKVQFPKEGCPLGVLVNALNNMVAAGQATPQSRITVITYMNGTLREIIVHTDPRELAPYARPTTGVVLPDGQISYGQPPFDR